ncbi:DNA cytosine methyltransferase [Paracoccus denitrificans]|uniref:DNA cytosine methyltransferase n=1 Tax=Paracoccus denitrificans TaxID=266 RepID=UPI001E52E694|nr:DNA cytosine methyltransferase [Paracoccus denitrificans]UFS67418.1 DNA cytosine methyltransferase [Paracoccus denitrificans]
MRPVAVDLFAGAGGMSLGFEQAGFDVVAAVEIDPVHAATHEFNFPDCAVICGSVSDVSGEEIRKAAKLGERKVDLVFGGPPCQGFSLIGKRQLDDPRNSLLKDFVRIARELDASYIVLENVKGLTVGKHRAMLDELVQLFEDAGYEIRLPWRVLDAADFGVPQHRERLFLMGAKKGLPVPVYPSATCTPADAESSDKLPSGPSCKDALGDLPNPDKFASLKSGDSVRTKSWGKPSEYAQIMRCMDESGWFYGYRRGFDSTALTSSAYTDHSEISRRRFGATEPGAVEPISRLFKLHPNGLSNTLRAGTDGARGAFTSPRPIHYSARRCVTVREMARLHGFPDWFRFNATKWHGARQIGNAVPPPLARAVAGAIMSAASFERTKPDEAIDLGSPSLLSMDLTTASNHFGVRKPPSKRDRKSGAKKRKQAEIERLRLMSPIAAE